ncbi:MULTISPECIES: hypothetical protein [unclassified Sphingomonas]|uniref:hypothetical protein n=1 Tax=unclassified Sphingomonas TaxID=196159 RepID=UPI000AA3330A|nr:MULTISPECIES: hypothetical protein [unclassified Sphingomonas]
MSSTSGSEQRQRHRDVRIRLRNEDELDQFDRHVKNAGFYGPHARGDWLRSHLPGVIVRPTPPPAPPAANPWADTIAAIDGLANELADIHLLVDRLVTGTLRFADPDRLRDTLPKTVAAILAKADAVIGFMHARIDGQ